MAQVEAAGRLSLAKQEFDALITPEVLEEAEELHRRMSHISVEDMFRPFTM